MLTVVLAAALAAAEPPPDPLAVEGQQTLTSVGVCLGACAGTGMLAAGLSTGLAPLIFAAPAVGLALGAGGAAIADAAFGASERREAWDGVDDLPTLPETPVARLWVPLWAAGGYVVFGGVAAVAGYYASVSTSSDGPDPDGLLGALLLGTAGGAIGAGIGTYGGLHTEPPAF